MRSIAVLPILAALAASSCDGASAPAHPVAPVTARAVAQQDRQAVDANKAYIEQGLDDARSKVEGHIAALDRQIAGLKQSANGQSVEVKGNVDRAVASLEETRKAVQRRAEALGHTARENVSRDTKIEWLKLEGALDEMSASVESLKRDIKSSL